MVKRVLFPTTKQSASESEDLFREAERAQWPPAADADVKDVPQVSAAAMAAPTNTTLKTEEATLFQGTTLRGLLLNAYAFGTMATIAGIGAIVSFVGAAILLVLSGIGFAHARQLRSAVEAPATVAEQRVIVAA